MKLGVELNINRLYYINIIPLIIITIEVIIIIVFIINDYTKAVFDILVIQFLVSFKELESSARAKILYIHHFVMRNELFQLYHC